MEGQVQADQRRLLAVLAHPDDESFAIGGTLAKYGVAGVQVVLLTATRGEAARGGEDPVWVAAHREQELWKAVGVLGVKTLRILGYQDGHLARADRPLLMSRLVAILRELRPQAVVTFGPDGISGHPDHVAIGEATSEAFSLSGQAGYTTGPTSGDLRPHHPLRLFHITPSPATRQCCRKGKGEFLAPGLTSVDVVAFRAVKVRAMQCHASQDQPFPGDPEVEAGRLHDREYFRLVWPTMDTPPADDLFEGLP
jgi:LmbE family N-acetylglucosaminyl deacetylase